MAENESNTGVLKPPGKMLPEELATFVRARAYRSSPLYAFDFARWRKAELYDQCEQWLQPARSASDSTYAMQWRGMAQDPRDPTSVPLPVYNEGVALRENESARLGRPEFKPRVRAKGDNPSVTSREGAQGAERALVSRLKEMPWDVRADLLFLHLPLYGGAWIESSWDQTWLETVRVPVLQSACSRNPRAQRPPAPPEFAPAGPPGQAETVADPTAPAFQGPPAGEAPPSPAILDGPGREFAETPAAQMPPPGSGPMMGADPMALLAGLPGLAPLPPPPPPPPCSFMAPQPQAPADGMCPLCGSPLVPFKPTLEEAAEPGPLGKDLPKGDWVLNVLPPYEVFARDAGIGVDRTDVDEWVRVHLETVDWVAERYPDKVHDPRTGEELIKGANPAELMAQNPTLGAPDVLKAGPTAGVAKRHVLVMDYHRHPWFEWNAERKAYAKNRGRSVVLVQQAGGRDVVCLDAEYMIESLNAPGTFVQRVHLEFVPWEFKDGGRRSTVGQSLWDRLFDIQNGVNERKSQIRATNQRTAVPLYLENRTKNLREAPGMDLAIPGRRILVDVDPGDQRPALELVNNTTIADGVYREYETDIDSANRISGNVEVEKGQVPPGVSAATAIAYLKTEAGEKRRPRITRARESLVRAWRHGIELMSAYYIEPRPYSYEDETGEERWSWIHGNVIAQANPKVDIYPTPDYDVTDARRETMRDLVQLGVIQPQSSPRLQRKVVEFIDEQTAEVLFEDDNLQEQQAQREWQLFKDTGRVPVIDPSLDDAETHYEEHGRACFTPIYRQWEEKGRWDEALAVIGSQWKESLLQMGLALPPGTSLQTAILQFWQAQLGPAGQNPDLAKCLTWRAHMEAHELAIRIQQVRSQPAVEAPGQGTAGPEGGQPTDEAQPAAAPPMAPMPQGVQ